MDHKMKWLLTLMIIILIASACNLFTNFFNPVDEVVSQVENLAEEVDTDKIESEIETLVTQLPAEIPDIGDLGDLGDLEATAQAIQDSFDSGEMPAEVPLVEDPVEIIFSSKELLTYTTPLDFDTVLSFYQEKMTEYGWETQEDGNIFLGEMASLQFEKPDREASVILNVNPQDGTTMVTVTIQMK